LLRAVFDEDRFSCGNRLQRQRRMCPVRRADHHGIDVRIADQSIRICDDAHAKGRCYRFGATAIEILHGDQPGIRDALGQNGRVIGTHDAGSDDTDPDLFH